MSVNKSRLICRCAERGLVDLANMPDSPTDESVVVIPDLCRAAAEKDPLLTEIAGSESAVVHACHARAVRSLFAFADCPLPESATIIDHRRSNSEHAPSPELEDKPPAWYPVIDYDRCTSCGQCHDFCLFGVYRKERDGRVVVANPDHCKNNCPACARICPEAAIIFPKSGETPINGAEIEDEAALQSTIKVNVDEILGDDVYAALKARKQKRRSLLNRKKIEQALAERRNCSGGDA